MGILRDIGAPGLIIIILGVNKGSEEADQDAKEDKKEKE